MSQRGPEDRDSPREGLDAGRGRRERLDRLILWLAAIVLAVVLVVLAAAYLPGWWAGRVADVVAGNRTAGALGGLVCGAVCTALPLLVLRAAVRAGLRIRERLVRLVFAVLVAAPNLLTLGVELRGGPDGAAARAVLDARGQGFRGATPVGVAVGAVVVVGSWVLLAGRRRRLHELADLRTRLELRDVRDAAAGETGTREAGTGETGTGEAGTGKAGTGKAGTGEAGTGEAGTGKAGTGEAGTGKAGTGEAGTGPVDRPARPTGDIREPRDRPDA